MEPDDLRAVERDLPRVDELRVEPEREDDADLRPLLREDPDDFLRAVEPERVEPDERDPPREAELFFLEELDFLAGISV